MNKLDSIRKNLKTQKPSDLLKPLSINPQKRSNTLKPFVGKLPKKKKENNFKIAPFFFYKQDFFSTQPQCCSTFS